MELKNALTVCLISLFSATLVLLMARVLDLQAAARLEPQLTRIVEELEGLRKQGGIAAAAPTGQPSPALAETASDALLVYYFHSKTRCPTCRDIESQSQAVVQSAFAAELGSGDVVWKVLNYEERPVADLAKKFEIQMPVVVLAKMKGGEIADWKRLDRVWALVGDKAGFATYVRDEINKMLRPAEPQPTLASPRDKPEVQDAVAGPADKPASPPADLPIPQ
jgi:thiol-disulfide isomerase/thioredoxin